ncbi:MAG: hypothetical protein ABF714_01350, partial [Novacetimonas hansenii]
EAESGVVWVSLVRGPRPRWGGGRGGGGGGPPPPPPARWQVSADPEEHVEQVAAYIRRGFNHLVFHAPGPDQQRFLSLYAKEILPRLRRRFGAA